MATVFYPAIVERAGEGYSVFFPDLPGCTSAGATVQEAALGAEEALAGHLLVTLEHGESLPDPTEVDAVERDPEVDEVARILVRGDRPGRSVRLNITMDEGLVAAIDRVTNNRSGFISNAARRMLSLSASPAAEHVPGVLFDTTFLQGAFANPGHHLVPHPAAAAGLVLPGAEAPSHRYLMTAILPTTQKGKPRSKV